MVLGSLAHTLVVRVLQLPGIFYPPATTLYDSCLRGSALLFLGEDSRKPIHTHCGQQRETKWQTGARREGRPPPSRVWLGEEPLGALGGDRRGSRCKAGRFGQGQGS